MTMLRLIAIGAGVVLAATPALAWHRHHRPLHAYAHPAPTYGYGYPYSYAGGWQAGAIARATAAQQASPGLTEELAPDAKETATGGPVGGVPGFSGGK